MITHTQYAAKPFYGIKWEDFLKLNKARETAMYYLRNAYKEDSELPPVMWMVEHSKPLSPLHRVIKRFNEYRI